MQIEYFRTSFRHHLAAAARIVSRWGLIALLLLWGTAKFGPAEAGAIQPMIEHSPFLSWMYPAFGVQGASNVIGVIEVTAAVLMATRRWLPTLSAIGSLIAAVTFATTLSFLFTTPGALAADNPLGGFLMKDVLLLGAALAGAAEALDASARARGRGHA